MKQRRVQSGDTVALVVAVALVAAVLLDVGSWLRTPLALVFVGWVPGSAVTAWMPALTRAERRGIAVTLSLAACVLVPTFAIWVHWWHPGALFAFLAAASIVSLSVAHRRARHEEHPGSWTEMLEPVPSRARWLVATSLAVAAGAGGLALLQLARHDHGAGRWGLLPQLPAAWFIAAIAVALAGGFAFRSRVPGALPATTLLVVALLHATTAVAYAVPRFAWTYKHLGVTEYLLEHGHASSSVDIYQNWPGFFSLTAFLVDLGAVGDRLTLLRWWPSLIGLAAVVVLRFFFGALTDDARILWGAVALFVVANWFGQDYFSPQSVAFVLGFGTFGLLLRTNAAPERLQFTVGARERRALAYLAIVVFAAITVTHQLTPYLLLPGVVVATAIGAVRPRWVAVICTLMALGYLAPRFGWVVEHGGIASTSVGDNVRSPAAELAGAAWSVTVSNWASRVLTGALALASIPYLLRYRRDRWWTLFLLSNLIGPALVLVVQAYGNEGVLRTSLFVAPWMAFAAVATLVHRPLESRRVGAGAGLLFGAAIGGGIALFVLATWGLDARYRIDPGEVRLEEAFEATAPDGAVLAQLGPQHLPLRMSARYPAFEFTVLAPFAEGPREVEEVLGELEQAAADVSRRRAVFIASTASADRFAGLFGYGDSDSYAALREAIRRSPRWSVVLDVDDNLLARFER